jgi:hypothetical protein
VPTTIVFTGGVTLTVDENREETITALRQAQAQWPAPLQMQGKEVWIYAGHVLYLQETESSEPFVA